MKLVLGFLLLGFLVGDMAGLTSESVVSKLIALLFALFGGSFVLLYQKFTPAERSQVGSLIAAISLGTLLGIHAGILTTQFRLLSPKTALAVQASVIPQQPVLAPVLTQPAPAITATAHPRPEPTRPVSQPPPKCPDAADSPYLRKQVMAGADLVDSQLQGNVITIDQAYKQLHALLEDRK